RSGADQLGLPPPALQQPLRRVTTYAQPDRGRAPAARTPSAHWRLAAGRRSLPPPRRRHTGRPLPSWGGAPSGQAAVPSPPRIGRGPMTSARTLADALLLTLTGGSTLVTAQPVAQRWDIRHDESSMLPVSSPSLSPGEVESRDLELPALTRLFL